MVSTEASRNLAHRVPNISAVMIDYARHEILNETTELREQFWAAFDSFVADRRSKVRMARGPRRLRRAAG